MRQVITLHNKILIYNLQNTNDSGISRSRSIRILRYVLSLIVTFYYFQLHKLDSSSPNRQIFSFPTTLSSREKREKTGTRVPRCRFAVCSTESLIKSVSHVCWLPQQELGKAQRGYIVRSMADETSDRSVNRDEECLKGTIVNDLDSLAHLLLTRGSSWRGIRSKKEQQVRSRFVNVSQQPEQPLEKTEIRNNSGRKRE